MRSLAKVAALTVFAAATLSAPLAYAGFDEAGENSFWSHQSAAPEATTPRPADHERYRATYAEPTAQAPATAPEKDPPQFYHAMGTMGQP